MIEQLTKENFWNSMMEKHPNAMKHFCKWVDEYKARVDWQTLFDHNAWPKYHNLPGAMQFGIFVEFLQSFNAPDDLPWSLNPNVPVRNLVEYVLINMEEYQLYEPKEKEA